VGIEGLVQIVVGALFQGHGPFGGLADLGEQDDGCPIVWLPQVTQYLAAIHPGHEHI
jgi:hypothetical protein